MANTGLGPHIKYGKKIKLHTKNTNGCSVHTPSLFVYSVPQITSKNSGVLVSQSAFGFSPSAAVPITVTFSSCAPCIVCGLREQNAELIHKHKLTMKQETVKMGTDTKGLNY